MVPRQPPLADEILASVAVLERGSASVRAVMTGEDNRFTRALGDLRRLATAEGIPMAIVGGLAAIRYGYPAATQDIDIAVGRDRLALLVQAAPRYGFKVAWEAPSGWHTLTHDDVEINIIPEGGKARSTAPTSIPGPGALGVTQGLDYATLPGWMELKLSSGRQKDRAHVVEVLKKADAASIEAARDRLGQVHPTYLALLEQLRREAELEKTQEDERGQRE